MARQLRIEYPGAFYHVFSRGNQKQLISFSDEDRCFFLNCLRIACEKFGGIVHVYCLMPNHYHLFLETPLGNLSRMMHLLITNYTLYFNKKNDRCGHLFQGRFKSILVDAVGYAKELSKYIHLNPVRSGVVERPEQYQWSSYGYYRGEARPGRWLEVSFVLGLFGDDLEASKKAYAAFVMEGLAEDVLEFIRDSRHKGILGSEDFILKIKKEHLKGLLGRPDREKPQLTKLKPKADLDQIKQLCIEALGPGNIFAIPIAIFISHNRTDLKLSEIGEFYSLSISAVSNICSRTRAAIVENEALSRAVREIEERIEK